MSDFEHSDFSFGDLHQQRAENNSSSTEREHHNPKLTNFDDFERLERDSLEEQRHESELESHSLGKNTAMEFEADSLSSSPVIMSTTHRHHHHHDEEEDDDISYQQQQHHSIPTNPASNVKNLLDLDEERDTMEFSSKSSSHLSSTDRPLVTSEPLPETTELHLTPDPEDKFGLGLNEPFVNVTGNLEQHYQSSVSPSGIYPGKLYAHSYPINQPLDDEEDEEIVEEEAEEPQHPVVTAAPDVLHPSAPDLINHGEELEDFSDLNREDSPPPSYEAPQEKHQEEPERRPSPHFTTETITFDSEPTKEVESHPQPTSRIEELIEELTPPFAACPSAAPPQKRDESPSPAPHKKTCGFHPRAWFKPENLDPRVADLIYWRDIKRSAIAFAVGLVLLLSLSYFSFISVLAYTFLTLLTGTLSYRVYKNVLQAVQKSSDGHPFKQYLDIDLSLSRDNVGNVTDTIIKHLESTAKGLRRLFLVEDLIDSLKFAVVLWCFTYIGAWFNGLTLVILVFVSLFTLPKVYETYKTQIDHYLHIAVTQVDDVVNKIKAKIPIGKKPKQQ